VERRSNISVRVIEEEGDGFKLDVGGSSIAADKVILCCGPWITKLVPEFRAAVMLQRKVIHWLTCEPGVCALENNFKPFCIDDDGRCSLERILANDL